MNVKNLSFLLSLIFVMCVNVENLHAQALYDSTEIAKLKSFLLQESSDSGVKNYQQLGIENIENVTWGSVTGLSWSSGHLLEQILWDEKKLSGNLDLSGFKALMSVSCISNSIKSINVKNSTKLSILDLYENGLDSIDVTTNPSLIYLRIGYNNVKKINLLNNPNLIFFCCTKNQLDSIDLSHKAYLKTFYCLFNKLDYLNIADCPKLQTVSAYYNKLTELDLSGLYSLTSLVCSYNNLSKLDTKDCTSLTELECTNNVLDTLNVSMCGALKSLNCNDNSLKKLTVKNCSALSDLYCNNNKLDSLNVEGCGNLSVLECKNNKLSYSTLPSPKINFSSYIYSPQNKIAVEYKCDSVDFRDIYVINDYLSDFSWYDGYGIASPLKNENGLFAFDDSYKDKTLVCYVSNQAFPQLVVHYDVSLTGKDQVGNVLPEMKNVSIYGGRGCVYLKTKTDITVNIYSIRGTLILRKTIKDGINVLYLPRGLYVVAPDHGNSVKILVK